MTYKLEEVDKMEEASKYADEKFDRFCRYCKHYTEGEGTDKQVCYDCMPSNIKEERKDRPYVGVESFDPDDNLMITYGVEVSGVNKEGDLVINIDSLIKQYKNGCYEYIDEDDIDEKKVQDK